MRRKKRGRKKPSRTRACYTHRSRGNRSVHHRSRKNVPRGISVYLRPPYQRRCILYTLYKPRRRNYLSDKNLTQKMLSSDLDDEGLTDKNDM